MKNTVYIIKVYMALAFILGVLGYTAAKADVFVSSSTVLTVIQK